MKRIAYWGLPLLLIVAVATPGFAQNITDRAEYDAYSAIFKEKDPGKQAAVAEKFLADYPKTDAKVQSYTFIIMGYGQGGIWPKALEWADKQEQMAPSLPVAQKNTVLLIGLTAANQLKNNGKTREYAEKLLVADPNDFNALITLSTLLSQTLPTDESAKQAQMGRTLEITNRALGIKAKPGGYTDAQWNAVQVQLHRTASLMLLNQKKYAESMSECQVALKINGKDGDCWYLIGLSQKVTFTELYKKYVDATNEYNANRTADQLTVDENRAKMEGAEKAAEKQKDETLDAFARAVAAGGGAAGQAREELNKLFTGSPDELNKLIDEKKGLLGN